MAQTGIETMPQANPIQSPTTTPQNVTNIKPVNNMSSAPASMVQSLGGTPVNTSGTGTTGTSGYTKEQQADIWRQMTSQQQKDALKQGPNTGTLQTRTQKQPAPGNGLTSWGNVQNQFQNQTGGAFNAEAALAAGMDPMQVERMYAAYAANNDHAVGENEYSSHQLDNILAKDSPLMQLAAQDGIDYAQRRGGANSSLAAGSSMREMTRQATPLALQQAEAERAAAAQNQQIEAARLEANAGRLQQGNMFNADAENQATAREFDSEANRRRDNAAITTDTNVRNAAMSNDMQIADRKNTLTMALQQLSGDQDYARLQSANQSAERLADMENRNRALISGNDSASRILTATTQAVADILSNSDIKGDEATVKIQSILDSTQDSLNVIGALNNLDLSFLS